MSIMGYPKALERSAFSLPWSRRQAASAGAAGRLIALHIAAANPLALDEAGLDPAAVARERAVLAGKNADKPAHKLEKIIESGLKTYFKEVCLLDQPSIHAEHAGKTIGQAVQEAEKSAGEPIHLKAFVRYALGEEIEKQESDFAAEVAAARGETKPRTVTAWYEAECVRFGQFLDAFAYCLYLTCGRFRGRFKNAHRRIGSIRFSREDFYVCSPYFFACLRLCGVDLVGRRAYWTISGPRA